MNLVTTASMTSKICHEAHSVVPQKWLVGYRLTCRHGLDRITVSYLLPGMKRTIPSVRPALYMSAYLWTRRLRLVLMLWPVWPTPPPACDRVSGPGHTTRWVVWLENKKSWINLDHLQVTQNHKCKPAGGQSQQAPRPWMSVRAGPSIQDWSVGSQSHSPWNHLQNNSESPSAFSKFSSMACKVRKKAKRNHNRHFLCQTAVWMTLACADQGHQAGLGPDSESDPVRV